VFRLADFHARQLGGPLEKSFRPMPIPGAINARQYSPFFEIASKVRAVPKSTTMQGPPYFS